MEITDLTALELAAAIQRGDVTIKEAHRTVQDVIAAREGELHSFITVSERESSRREWYLDRETALPKNTPLFGVPMAIKDNICTQGVMTSCGSRMLDGFIPPYNATVATKLDLTGALCLGKLNMDEFAMGSTTETSYYGPTRNPWDLERVPGGSSGGAAAAVAAGLCWYALGSDTGGSIRQPASYCGVTGMKPTYGTVSRYGLVAYASSLDQIGPLCRDAADCAAVLDIIQGQDPKDSTSLPGEYGNLLDSLTGDLRGLRVGIPVDFFGDGLNDEVRRAVLAVADVLKERGAQVTELTFPVLKYVVPTYYIIASAEASSNLSRYDGVKYGWRSARGETLGELYANSRTEGFGSEVKRRILLGTFVLSSGYYDAYYKKALQVKAVIKDAFDQAFQQCDLLLTPVAPTTAPKLGESLSDPLQMYLSDIYTVSVNLAGLPALSMPCGLDSRGLPIGAQLIGRHFGESTILNAAYAFQQETDFHKKRPGQLPSPPETSDEPARKTAAIIRFPGGAGDEKGRGK